MMGPKGMITKTCIIFFTLLAILLAPQFVYVIYFNVFDLRKNTKVIDLSVMTFNIEIFNSAGTGSSTGRINKIADRIIKHQPDIVLLQEDLYDLEMNIAGYTRIGQCKAEPLTWEQVIEIFPTSKYLANSIWAKQSFIDKYHLPDPAVTHLNLSHHCPDPRCSVIADFGLFSIASVHLCGGRFADELFLNGTANDIINAKDDSLLHLIKQSNPTFIGGDFNGERDRNIMHSLGSYPLLKELDKEAKRDFIKFFQSGHEIIEKHGYIPLYCEDEVESTSKFGPVVDWIYFKQSDSIQLRYKQVQKVYACDISDHDAVVVTMRISINECLK